MGIDYRKELISAAKTMILVHEPDVLIKMIVRTIVQKVNVHHAGILLHDREMDSYILTVSRGTTGIKIPAGFARMDSDNPLIQFFRKNFDKQIFNDAAVGLDDIQRVLKRKRLGSNMKQLLKKVSYQMEIFEAVVCIPSYFRDELLGMLLLGSKRNGRKFTHEELDFFVALASDVAMAIRNAALFKQLADEFEKKKNLFLQTTLALAAAIEAKDHYTRGHTSRVTEICLGIAEVLGKADPAFLENLRIAASLHDIGKIGVSELILNKEGPLTEEERKKIQEHSLTGALILAPIKELELAILGVKYHHERYDGTGYPEGLKGEQIPLIASIISAADTFDAMTSDRPYRPGLPRQKAIDEIERMSGKQFAPNVADALVQLYKLGKI